MTLAQEHQVYVKSEVPTARRLLKILRESRNVSILRCIEYERLERLKLRGLILDFGGGEKTLYSSAVKSWGAEGTPFVCESANIDPATRPTYLIAEGQQIPCEPERFDAGLSLNTFEHIYDTLGTLKRIHRVLKPSASLYFVVPFMFRVHGHPNDYVRGTPAFWSEKLREAGYYAREVEALQWGPFTTSATVVGLPGPFKRLRLWCAIITDYVLAKIRFGSASDISAVQDHPTVNCALGYLVRAEKFEVASSDDCVQTN